MARIKHDVGMTFTGGSVNTFRMCALKRALKTELQGMRMTRGRTAYSIIKQEFGLKGSREKVLAAFTELVERQLAHDKLHIECSACGTVSAADVPQCPTCGVELKVGA